MSHMHTHSRNSLFMAELILALCFLSLVSAGCIRLFAAAYLDRTEARRLTYIQENTTRAGELLEGWDASPEQLSALFPESLREGNVFLIPFDSSWAVTEKENAFYYLRLEPLVTDNTKGALLTYTDVDGKELYSCEIRYPLLRPSEKGGARP